MSSIVDTAKLDKAYVRVTALGEAATDCQYWATKSLDERLAAMEYLRGLNYGQAAASARLQRVLTIAELGKS
jgi:hypothetical protein